MEEQGKLRRTPLYDAHVALGGRMVPFGGWEMPVQYKSILDEARAVRKRAGIFDVSHMGRVAVEGPGSAPFLDSVFSVAVSTLKIGRARYGAICNEDGGIIDDAIVLRRAENRFLLVPNASNTPPVLEWLRKWEPGPQRVTIQDLTDEYAMVAHQGPESFAMVGDLVPMDLAAVRRFAAVETELAGLPVTLSRTGYTGEDGFEAITPREHVETLWNLFVAMGAEPCGLGSRDVLRLEAGLLLHGNDIDTSTNPYEAGMDRFVDPDREGLVPGDALRRIRDEGPSRRLVGFSMVGRGVPRHGQPIVDGAESIGVVTSGGYSPTLDRNIGLGYVPNGYTAPGSRFHVDIRGRMVEAQVTALAFYSRSTA